MFLSSLDSRERAQDRSSFTQLYFMSFFLPHSSLPVSKIIRIVQLNDPVRGQNQTEQDEGEEL